MAFRGVDYLLIDSQFSEQELMVRQTRAGLSTNA